MGTNATMSINGGKHGTLATLYFQYDGYIYGGGTGLGSRIKLAVGDGKVPSDSYSLNQKAEDGVFAGIGCLGAWLIHKLKKGIGNVYLATPNDQEYYHYEISAKEEKAFIKVFTGDKVVYDGPVSEFDPEQAEEEDE